MHKTLPLAALLLAAGLAWGQPKVSGGSTPPADNQTAQDKAAAEKERREAAKKALDALKDKKGGKEGGRKSGR
jgi:hypothetical protein